MTTVKTNTSELKNFKASFEEMILTAKRKLLIFNVNESVENIKEGKYKKFTNADDAFVFLNN